MNPLAAYPAIVVAAGIPVWIHGSTPVMLLSLAAGALLWIAVTWRSLGSGLVGALSATAAYSIALWIEPATGIVEALAFGASLLIVLQHTDFARRFHGAEVMPAIASAAFWRWFVTVMLSAGSIVALTAAVTFVTDGAPPAFRPLLTGIGAFLALGAAIAVFGRAR